MDSDKVQKATINLLNEKYEQNKTIEATHVGTFFVTMGKADQRLEIDFAESLTEYEKTTNRALEVIQIKVSIGTPAKTKIGCTVVDPVAKLKVSTDMKTKKNYNAIIGGLRESDGTIQPIELVSASRKEVVSSVWVRAFLRSNNVDKTGCSNLIDRIKSVKSAIAALEKEGIKADLKNVAVGDHAKLTNILMSALPNENSVEHLEKATLNSWTTGHGTILISDLSTYTTQSFATEKNYPIEYTVSIEAIEAPTTEEIVSAARL